MKEETLTNILEWSGRQPLWQRDALRRIFVAGILTPLDLDDLFELAKAKQGLAEPRDAVPLERAHLAVGDGSTAPVVLTSATHHQGVNALAPEQTLTFGPSMTVVFGQNAAGKSGYTRILKQACRSRSREEVLGNVLTDEAPPVGSATIRFSVGGDPRVAVWGPAGTATSALASVSVFDGQSAPVYLRDKTDVAFRPYGLDAFDKLSGACDELRKRLEVEQRAIATPVALPQVAIGTRVASALSALTALTNTETLRALATLTDEEATRLGALTAKRRDLQAADPKKRSQELTLGANRIESLAAHLASIETVLGEGGIAAVGIARARLEVAQSALVTLRKSALTADLLAGTGEETWRRMWDAASGFSHVAYADEPFPVVAPDAKCPLCQQPLGDEAATRFKHFQELVTSTAQEDVRAAERSLTEAAGGLETLAVDPPAMALAIEELRSDSGALADRVADFLKSALTTQKAARAALTAGLPVSAIALPASPAGELKSLVQQMRDRAVGLLKEQPALDSAETQELIELEARAALSVGMEQVLAEVDRLKRVAAYAQCLTDMNTQGITRKSTELTTRLVTDHLQTAFRDEARGIEFTHLAVELRAAGGAKGALYHQVVFSNAPSTAVSKVLSEGESRALSLAAFLAELATAPTSSAIIFDDPVSSLDHVWRERIARRLVLEAKKRQVVVFTHDVLFLKFLRDEATKQAVAVSHQYVRRDGAASGLASPDLPWFAMGVTARIGILRKRWQEAEKVFRTLGSEDYEREARDIYGMLREAWEQAIGEVLLYGVIERYRPSIETQKVRVLHDILEEDCTAVEGGMTECSRWLRGHDAAPADGTPFPGPDQLAKGIDDLDTWAKRIRKRRS